MDRTSRQMISKETEDLNNTINQIDLTCICEKLHPTTAEYTLFSSTHETFSRMDHLLGHKIYLNKFKRIEIIKCIFTDHNGIK